MRLLLNTFFMIIVLVGFQANAQNQTSIRNIKSSKSTFKFPDTLNLNIPVNPKIDTLYLSNLTPSKKDGFVKDIMPLISIVIGAILGWLSQSYFKKQEKRINSDNLKDAKKIQHIETIASMINQLSLCDPINSAQLITLNNDLRKYVFDNNLYIDTPYEDLVEDVSDYYSKIAANFNQKNVATELEHLVRLKNLFTK